jgi:hypothetical protein
MSFERFSILIGQLSDSNRRIGLSVALGTVLFGIFGYSVDSAMTGLRIPAEIHAGMVGAVVGLGAGLAFFLLMAGLRERRMLLADEIRRLAELNHTVRNSLNLIALAHYSADYAHKKLILENTARIAEKLRELFPVVGSSDKWRKKRHDSL